MVWLVVGPQVARGRWQTIVGGGDARYQRALKWTSHSGVCQQGEDRAPTPDISGRPASSRACLMVEPLPLEVPNRVMGYRNISQSLCNRARSICVQYALERCLRPMSLGHLPGLLRLRAPAFRSISERFGSRYMLRLLTNRRLPKDIASFQALQHAFFPDRYEFGSPSRQRENMMSSWLPRTGWISSRFNSR